MISRGGLIDMISRGVVGCVHYGIEKDCQTVAE